MYLLAVAAALLVAGVVSLEGQSLADAARRAEEARKSAGATTPIFDMRDVDPVLARQELLGVQIDAAGWGRFLDADRAIARVMQSDAAGLQRFRALEVSTIRAFERFLHREAALLGALRTANVPPRDYASTHLALALAVQETRGTAAAIEALPSAVKANVEFIRSRDREVKTLTTPVVKLALRIAAPAAVTMAPVPVSATPASPPSAHSPRPASPPVSDDGPIDTRPGAEVPDFRFVDFNGNSRALGDFRGKYLLLDFWGSWCPPCRAEIPHAKEAYSRFRSRGFEILGMDYERDATVDQVRSYLTANGVGWTFARPDSVRDLIVERFRVNSFPTVILLDPDGRVVQTPRGALRGKALAETLDRILPR
jgi:thiol-disulfide isomerase/thioredoxin